MGERMSRFTQMQPSENLTRLKEAVMQASDPKEDHHIEGLFVLTIWVSNSAEDGEYTQALSESLVWPDYREEDILHILEHIIDDDDDDEEQP